MLSSQSCHTHTFPGPQLTLCNFPGKTFTCWRRGKACPERSWMSELPGRSSEDPGSPCWIFALSSTSTAGQGWRSCKTWLESLGSQPWSCWMWSPTWGTVLTVLTQSIYVTGSMSGLGQQGWSLDKNLGYSEWCFQWFWCIPLQDPAGGRGDNVY